jgi:hypothetical protein
MTFLTSRPDLSNTIFSDNHLHLARELLNSVISREDPPWLKKPQGILREYWERDDTQAACFLIDLAQMIYTLDARIAEKSAPRLYEKVRELLRPPSPEQFLEKLTELQVAFALVAFVSPLTFLTSEDFSQPKVSRCPDFAFQTPEGAVFVDATVFHGGILDLWTQSTHYIKTSLQDDMLKQNRMLYVHISLPLKAEMEVKEIVSLVLKEMNATTDTGSVLIGHKGRIEWEPFPIIALEDASSPPPEITPPARAFVSPGAIIDQAFGSSTKIDFSSEKDVQQARELVLKSLRNKLKEKHGQFPSNEPEPCLLVMRLEHHQLGVGDIAAMLQKRIWPNEQEYDWLSGLVLFTPRSGFSPTDDNMYLKLYPNPRTYRPVTNSLMAIFNGTAQYHLNL